MKLIYLSALFNNFILINSLFTQNKISKQFKILKKDSLDSKSSIIFLPEKINDKYIPYNYYGNFLNNNVNNNFKIFVPECNLDKTNILCNKLSDQNNESLIIISHSNSALDSIELCNNNNINNLILLDPIYNKITYTAKKKKKNFSNDYAKDSFNFLKDVSNSLPFNSEKENKDYYILDDEDYTNYNSNSDEDVTLLEKINVDNILLISSDLSNKWNFFPFIPPISLLNLDITLYDTDNVNLKEVNVKEFGHYDIMDSPWRDIISQYVSKGNNNRDPIKLMEYQNKIANMINSFVENKTI